MTGEPNVVLITTDQQRADASAREGFALDTTPFLDELARDGIWFDRAYTTSPVCVPARESLLTGRFPTAHRVWRNGTQDGALYEADIFDVMNDAGYRTAMIGKNHSHLDETKPDHWFELSHWGAVGATKDRRTPEETRFDEWISDLSIFEDGGGFSDEPAPCTPDEQCVSRCVTAAAEWLSSDDDEPFFLWLSIPEPHNPYQVPEPYFSMFPPDELPPVDAGPEDVEGKRFKWQWMRAIGAERVRRKSSEYEYDQLLPRLRSNYYGMLRLIDDQIRRFVSALESMRLRDNTLIAFHSDHGDFAGDYGLMRKGVDLPDATTRIPLLFTGPAIGRPSTGDPHPAHVSIVDILPTLCDTVGRSIPPGVQGRSLRPLLRGSDYRQDDFASVYAEAGYGGRHYSAEDVPPLEAASVDELNEFTQSGRTAMVRQGPWKLVVDMGDGAELYNVAEDPAETVDRSGDPDCSEAVRNLLTEFAIWTLRAREPPQDQ